MSKCDTCSNDAEYVFTECEDEKHFCEKCAIQFCIDLYGDDGYLDRY